MEQQLQTNTGYFCKKNSHGSVLVPMLLASAEACKLMYGPHNLSWAYSSTSTATRSGSITTGFNCPDGKTCNDCFPDLAAGQKVVLTSLPSVIPYGFGAVPREGPIDNMGDAFAHMDNGPDQGVDLKPIHDAVLLLAKNRGRSFHLTNAAGEDGSIAIDHIDGTFLTDIGSPAALCASFTGSIGQLDRCYKDGKRVKKEVTWLQNLFAKKWILKNPNEAGAYMKDVPTAQGKTHPARWREAEGGCEATTGKCQKKMTTPRAIGKMEIQLLLSTSDADSYVLREVNEIL